MNKNTLAQAISGQFRRALKMFREAIQAFPAEEWRVGDSHYVRPAGLAYHALETIDFYTSDQPADLFFWGNRFGVDWEDQRSQLLPEQEQLTVYLDEIEGKLVHWFKTVDLTAPERSYPWTGVSKLERTVYMLRHTHHHLAEMCLELSRRGYSAPEWH
jgi:hypothetical protein